jgi:hypothetical protein
MSEQQEKSIYGLPPELEEHEKQVDQTAERVHEGFDSFAGGDAVDIQRQRFALRDFRESDYAHDPDDAIGDDAAEQAYRAAKKLQRQFQSKAPTQEEIEQLDGDQFAERLREWTRSARSQDDEDGQQARAFYRCRCSGAA